MWGLQSRSVAGPLVRSYRTFSPLPESERENRGLAGLTPIKFTALGRFNSIGVRPARPRFSLSLPGGMFSVALSVPYGPSSYEAHCPAEFGLSSAKSRDRPPARHNSIYDLKPFTNFCNLSGSGEWNSRGIPVEGWVKRSSAACRKYR